MSSRIVPSAVCVLLGDRLQVFVGHPNGRLEVFLHRDQARPALTDSGPHLVEPTGEGVGAAGVVEPGLHLRRRPSSTLVEGGPQLFQDLGGRQVGRRALGDPADGGPGALPDLVQQGESGSEAHQIQRARVVGEHRAQLFIDRTEEVPRLLVAEGARGVPDPFLALRVRRFLRRDQREAVHLLGTDAVAGADPQRGVVGGDRQHPERPGLGLGRDEVTGEIGVAEHHPFGRGARKLPDPVLVGGGEEYQGVHRPARVHLGSRPLQLVHEGGPDLAADLGVGVEAVSGLGHQVPQADRVLGRCRGPCGGSAWSGTGPDRAGSPAAPATGRRSGRPYPSFPPGARTRSRMKRVLRRVNSYLLILI